MNGEKINNSTIKPRILVAPLDWGLGHATRCIPIIQTLLKHNADVLLAATGGVKFLLEKEFPQLKILHLEGYQITYTRRKKFFLPKLATQLPKLFFAIRNEKKWLKKILKEEKINAVISDNRPGLYDAYIPCVYITHQLQIKTGSKITDTLIRNFHYSFINRFQECWIPDNQSGQSLAGKLSHPVSFPAIPFKYLGPLSRFEKNQLPVAYDFLLLVSGPEPQRTILEEKLLQVFEQGTYSFVLVRGLPLEKKTLVLQSTRSKVFNHLSARELNEIILQSNIVVARAGYSTIMDLAKLEKKAVLIATPGQTEQEYLAEFLNDKNLFASISQEDISLHTIETAYKKTTEMIPDSYAMMHEEVIIEWLAKLRHRASAM